MDKVTREPKSNKLPIASSPTKGNKYKNFLTSILSPKKPLRQKVVSSPHLLLEKATLKPNTKSTCLSNESIYSSMEDTETTHHQKLSFQSSLLHSESSSEIDVVRDLPKSAEINHQTARFEISDGSLKEPVYATVNKTKNSPVRVLENSATQEVKEDNKVLVQRMKELSEENRLLRKQTQDLAKEGKMKEQTLHAKLQLEITQLEAETRKEVKSLSERIQILIKEKSLMNDQIDLLQQEKKELQTGYDALSERTKAMVSPELHRKMLAEYRKLLKDSKEKHQEETNEYKQQCETLEEARSSLQVQVHELREKFTSLQMKIETIEGKNRNICQENTGFLEQIEESKHIDHENQKLLLSLLKVTESLAMERDILLNKASFQENQQKELQTSVVDYSLNVGRLQEHISNLSRENSQELLNFHTRKSFRNENIQEVYAKQLEILREKILNQNNTIIELESEKRKLELQLECRWELPHIEDKIYMNK